MTRRFDGDKILVATHNAGKLEEMEQLFAPYNVTIVGAADDSGIQVDGLDGAPGVYTADWAETPNGRDFIMAMTRTHDALIARDAPQPWTARFCSTLVLAWPDGHDEVFEGTAEGTLVWPMRGKQGHGYDPMFQPIGHDRTFAEMTFDEKNAISHRADSFKKLIAGSFG